MSSVGARQERWGGRSHVLRRMCLKRTELSGRARGHGARRVRVVVVAWGGRPSEALPQWEMGSTEAFSEGGPGHMGQGQVQGGYLGGCHHDGGPTWGAEMELVRRGGVRFCLHSHSQGGRVY